MHLPLTSQPPRPEPPRNARDAAAVRDLLRRTGQMGVPVIEIDGKPVVGFDRPRISRLLGLRG